MTGAATIILYSILFMAIYVQVFFLITFIEKRKHITHTKGREPKRLPCVTVIVPCFNEEKTVRGTVDSLLALDYPKDRISIIVVDDGSTDDTRAVIQKYKHNTQVRLFAKENGGKHTALNLALKHVDTEMVGCLDADSFVDPETLKRMMVHFEDRDVMAVAPAVLVYKAKTIVQRAQKAEYNMAVYTKKMLGLMNGLHVASGAFSIFRKEVFDKLGGYRKAHNGEDLEITYRMQVNNMKVAQCHDAYTYTVAPDTVRKLYRQRLRWIYGFINNTIDYKWALFRKKYGDFAFFTVPAGLISIIAAMYLFVNFMIRIGKKASEYIVEINAVGVHSLATASQVDWFFVYPEFLLILILTLYGFVIFALIMGQKMAEGRFKIPLDALYFITLYSFIAPFWLVKAVYSTVFSRKVSWK